MSTPHFRQTWLAIGPVVVAFVAAAFLLHSPAFRNGQALEDAALKEGTTPVMAKMGGIPIHCRDLASIGPVLEGWKDRGGRPYAVLLGNSQVHAINQLKPSDRPIPAHLAERLAAKHLELLAVSPPNASLQEHYAVFEYLCSTAPPEFLILAVCCDDTRNHEIRPTIAAELNDAEVGELLSATSIGRSILERCAAANESNADLAGVEKTVQEHSEKYLNNRLAETSSAWAGRPEVRGRLFLLLYQLRNAALGITPQTKRKMIPGRYADNLAAYESILQTAQSRGIGVLVYNIPLRNDVEAPYIASEYRRFKEDIETLAGDYAATYRDFEDLVPAEYWGAKESTSIAGNNLELDFMHFQGPGHRILAEKLAEEINGPRVASGTKRTR